jgi:hypothetical protein
MKTFHASVLLLLVGKIPQAYGQKATNKPPEKLIETTVCMVLDEPWAYNNKLVKVRGYVRANFEYSVLLDEQCPDNGIWFAFADGSGPPELAMTVRGKGTPGGKDSKGRATPPIPVRLIKDSNFKELEHYWALSVRGEACADEPPPPFPPDCTTYRVTATFIGRVDGVSKKVHAAHLKKSSRDAVGGEGFGHMGIFDAQIVVQSVENVVAVDESEIRKLQTRSQ